MSAPSPVRLGRVVEWLLAVLVTLFVLWVTIGLTPGRWQSHPAPAGYNLRPFANVQVVLSCARAGKLFSPAVAFHILSIIGNVGLFWIWGFVAVMAASPSGKVSLATAAWVVIAGFAFSFGIEALQVFLPERAADVDDLIANGAGVLLGVIHALLRRRAAIVWS
jgi:glycopeptide antibiotics resistance protein